MRRSGVGIGAVSKKQLQEKKFAEQATQIAENQIEQLTKQMDSFKTYLEEFSIKYKSQIKQNPQFRKQFQDMCANIGVDPLASAKGFWSELLGVGDFYYEIIVQIYEICSAYEDRTGGLLYLDFVLAKLNRLRSKAHNNSLVSVDDCVRAIQKLSCLGNSFKLLTMNNERLLIQSVANELNDDHVTILKFAELNNGCLTLNEVVLNLKWMEERANIVLDFMIKDGIIWIDIDSKSTVSFYFPTFFRLASL
jgi:ESCRT-II complex subunit VPS22